jgi:hypothetical protein
MWQCSILLCGRNIRAVKSAMIMHQRDTGQFKDYEWATGVGEFQRCADYSYHKVELAKNKV